ncbi:hypothetical protein [Arenibacter amylolyticus]|uniref:hypothetical protein n=1 Tax=Arenibacter amylolyticus TaxID=1406873 RepID=UPI000A3C5EBD|nr:hypothetical protein [Arenibacter amylolyticus]
MYDFEKLKAEIQHLPLREQQIKLIGAKANYLQTVMPSLNDEIEISFAEKCSLEIEKIKELRKLGVF